MPEIFSIDSLIALLTLTTLEVVLGIDNVIFIAIIADKLPPPQRPQARYLGLGLAAVTRVLLLLVITWVIRLESHALFSVFGHDVTGKDLVMLGGGLFLIGKATYEIHDKLEAPTEHAGARGNGAAAFGLVLAQILAVDMVFSIDSIITAIGMTDKLPVMIAAVIIAVAIMMWFAGPVARFVEKHPTMRMLALAFLVLIGVMLVAEGSGRHIEKGYIYFAMAFSFVVELLNIRMRKRHAPVPLHRPRAESTSDA
ncbi:MAG: TerC family protein [Planctomycetota bacterium]|nr:MAG: TerC family protein [Planctomycetota bacterium]